MFELQVLLGNIVLPIGVVLVGWLACQTVGLEAPSRVTAFVLPISSSLAIWGAFAIRNGFSWWPEDAWQKIPVAALLVTAVAILADAIGAKAISGSPTSGSPTSSSAEEPPSRTGSPMQFSPKAIAQWIAITIAAACSAWLIFPRGDGWAELQSQQFQWCMVITLAASLAWWGIAGCQPRVASTVGLATIPLLIASAFVTSLSIMKITEPLIAVATVIGLCSLIDLRLTGFHRSLPMMIAPTLFTVSSCIAHANFQSYLFLPRSLYFLAMLSPALLALVARISQRKSPKTAIGVTITLALMLAAAIGIWGYIAGEVGSADE